MVFTACAMAFAHGSNDVANAVGPLAAIASVVQSGGETVSYTHLRAHEPREDRGVGRGGG